MTTRDIRPSTAITICDVCGRTLLRGERAEAYLHGGTRRWVCELCKSRALHEGWIKEGTLPDYNGAGSGSDRRRSLFGRLRSRRDTVQIPDLDSEPAPGYGDGDYREPDYAEPPPPARQARAGQAPASEPPPPVAPRRRRRRPIADTGEAAPAPAREPREPREPRSVRAVPASPEHKTGQAVQMFNASEHPRTVAGVARSLGLPTVSVLPAPGHTSLVNIVVSWELCWYRYEVDLGEDVPNVREAARGYELDELEPQERLPNAGRRRARRLGAEHLRWRRAHPEGPAGADSQAPGWERSIRISRR